VTRRGRSLTLVIGIALLGVLLLAAYLLPVPYVRLRPGPVFNALGEIDGKPVVSVDGAPTYPTDGSLNVTTVYEEGGPGSSLTLLQAFRGWLDPTMTVVPRDLLYSPADFKDENAAKQREQQGVAQMQSSEQSAVVAALRYVGEPVHPVVVVDSTSPGTPAADVLQSGDELLKVQGVRIREAADVRDEVNKVSPGDTITLQIRRDGKKQTIAIETIESPDEPGRPLIGVTPTISYESPVQVNIVLADVGGPSAGLMFALSTVDKLTPGALAAGRQVAGTGTINVRGRVGAIGGIAQKMAGARDDGADYFLAPAANCSEVVGHVPDGLRVIRVATLSGAVKALEHLGTAGASLPTCAA
jgi:PDZ domain-containing protein